MTAPDGTEAERNFFAHRLSLVESSQIGANTRIWAFAHVMEGARIGTDCNIGEQCFIESGVTLGNNVTVKNGVALWSGVTVEDDVFLGPNCVLTNDFNPRAYIKKGLEGLLATRILANATVGANATIICGVIIGRYAFVGAGAVVTRSVPDFALVVGNPARQTRWVCVCARNLSLSCKATLGDRCSCPACGRGFKRMESGLSITGGE